MLKNILYVAIGSIIINPFGSDSMQKKEQSTNEKYPTTTSEIEQRNKKPTIKVELCISLC